MQVKYNIKADQQPGDEDEDETRHQLHEHAVEPEVDGQHVVGGDPRVLQKVSIGKGKQRRRKTLLEFFYFCIKCLREQSFTQKYHFIMRIRQFCLLLMLINF